MFKACSILLAFPRFFIFCGCCFFLYYFVCPLLLVITCWESANLTPLCYDVSLCSLFTFSFECYKSGVILYCIESESLLHHYISELLWCRFIEKQSYIINNMCDTSKNKVITWILVKQKITDILTVLFWWCVWGLLSQRHQLGSPLCNSCNMPRLVSHIMLCKWRLCLSNPEGINLPVYVWVITCP